MEEKTDHKRILDLVDSDISAWSERRIAFQDDYEFAVIAGEKQWESREYAKRVHEGRPVICYNQMGPLIRSVCNGINGKAFSVHVTAQGEGASQDEAEFRAGVIRAIQITGGAQSARDTALRSASIGGFGFWRIIIAEGDKPGSRTIKYQRIDNALTVVPDPNAQEVSLCDMERCTVYVDMPKAVYKAKYPEGKAVDVGASDGLQNNPGNWESADTVRVAEFWEIVTGEDGTKTVRQTIVDGAGVLEESTFPGRYIPVFPAFGELDNVAGTKVCKGIVRDAKEPQMFKNFWKSEEYEFLSGRKQPPALVTPAMVTDPNTLATWDGDNRAFRLWEPDPEFPGLEPKFPPAPQIPSGYANASMEASQEIKIATGIFDARLGANTQETSGRALLVRQEQADVATAHYETHLKESIEHEGRVLNDLLPLVYSEAELVMFANEDGSLTTKEVSSIRSMVDYKTRYGFNGGAYGVRITVGPNFRTRREQFVSMLTEIGTKNPVIAQIGAPELIRAMDLPGSDELAKHVEAYLVKQGLREPKQEEGQPEIPPQVRQQIEQERSMIDQLTAKVEELTKQRDEIIRIAEEEKAQIARQSDAAAKLAQAEMDAQTELQKAQIQSASKREVAIIQAQTDIEIARIKEEAATGRALTEAVMTTPSIVTTPIEDGLYESDAPEMGYASEAVNDE
jgi:hypothetical protein